MVKTSRSTYCAEKVIITAGPWIARFLPQAYAHLFKVHRQVMYWFDIEEDCCSTFAPPGFPIFIWIFAKAGEFGFYGFPTLDGKRSRSRPSNLRRSAIQITAGGHHGRRAIHARE
jgi:glycine/D-amino acid oxidase-like deaminating enzyme